MLFIQSIRALLRLLADDYPCHSKLFVLFYFRLTADVMYKSLCRELDELLVEIIETCNNHIEVKANIEKSLQNTFLNIAKTRYINGNSSVTTLQLPTDAYEDLKPQALSLRSNDESGTHFVIENNLKKDNSSAVGKSANDPDSNVAGVNSDPIRLFGVLVPQSLKIAQKSSISAIDKIGEAAEVQANLHKKLLRYSKLSDLKNKLT